MEACRLEMDCVGRNVGRFLYDNEFVATAAVEEIRLLECMILALNVLALRMMHFASKIFLPAILVTW
jgi:hypothetical protein